MTVSGEGRAKTVGQKTDQAMAFLPARQAELENEEPLTGNL